MKEKSPTGRVVTLDKDLADEVFCGDIQDMFILCYEVIKVNFSGFFKKLGVQFGRQLRAMAKEKEKSSDTESSTLTQFSELELRECTRLSKRR